MIFFCAMATYVPFILLLKYKQEFILFFFKITEKTVYSKFHNRPFTISLKRKFTWKVKEKRRKVIN